MNTEVLSPFSNLYSFTSNNLRGRGKVREREDQRNIKTKDKGKLKFTYNSLCLIFKFT